MSIIHPTYTLASSHYRIKQLLNELSSYSLLSFDTETRSVYSKEERSIASKLVEQWKKDKQAESNYTRSEQRLIRQIARSSGLSYPELVQITHFIFGISETHSYIFICTDPQIEFTIWNWLSNYSGKLVIHNSLFDLKIMYNRIGKLPSNYDDTQLMARCLLNDADEFESKVGLKHLMADYYDPKWSLLAEDYEISDLKSETFLQYCSIDGCGTWKLYHMLQHELDQLKE